jgi:hypothetical protein
MRREDHLQTVRQGVGLVLDARRRDWVHEAEYTPVRHLGVR